MAPWMLINVALVGSLVNCAVWIGRITKFFLCYYRYLSVLYRSYTLKRLKDLTGGEGRKDY